MEDGRTDGSIASILGRVIPLSGPFGSLVSDQEGLVARRQLTDFGIDWERARNEIAARRWVERTPRVLSTTTGALHHEQRLWLAVLHAGPRSMLGSLSAAAKHGLDGWSRDHISVLVDDELSFEPVEGVDFFRSRRDFDAMQDTRPGIPRCRIEPAVLLFAGYEAETARAAYGVVAATVQQRLTTVDRFREWEARLRPLRRARVLRGALDDISGGAHSAAEGDVRAMCRRHSLPLPRSQRPRTDRAGRRRWTDNEWQLPDGTVVTLEVDGGHHTEVRQWTDDLRRHRRLTSRSRLVVRCSAYEVRHEADEVAADLIALGVTGRVPETAP